MRIARGSGRLLLSLALLTVVLGAGLDASDPVEPPRGDDQADFAPVLAASSPGMAPAGALNPATTQTPYTLLPTNDGMQEIVVPGGVGKGAFSAKSGVQLRFNQWWPGKFGYQVVRLEVSAQAALPAERQLTFRFSAGGYATEGRNIAVEKDAVLDADATSATIDLLVPSYLDWRTSRLETWIDGRKDGELSVEGLPVLRQGPAEMFAVLWSSGSPDKVPNFLGDLSEGQVQHRRLQLAEMPTAWLAYSALDLVVLDASEFERLYQLHPAAYHALLRWIRTGGNLWLLEAGVDWEQLDAVERTLHQQEDAKLADRPKVGSAPSAKGTPPRAPPEAWHPLPLGERAQQPVESVLALEGTDSVFSAEASTTRPAELDDVLRFLRSGQRSRFADNTTSALWFISRAWGFGQITAFRNAALEVEGSRRVRAAVPIVQKSPLQPRLSWIQRHGFSPEQGSPEFNDWLIPGVGVAPVGMFQLLASLFVVLIGPVNYWWLRRSGKLPLLILTTPLGAAAITLLIFLYGIVGDGLGVQLRARSVTILDQRAARAASWTRLSYFAGIAPENGLQFSTDTAVYPLVPERRGARRSRNRTSDQQRELIWGESQELPRGWLQTRTPTQYLTIRESDCARALRIREESQSLHVVNDLGADVLHVALQDGQGRFFWSDRIPQGGETELSPLTATEVFAKLREVFAVHERAYPDGAPAPSLGNRGYYGPFLSGSLLEAQISALYSPVTRALGTRHYVAVAETGPIFEAGIEEMATEASFHVVRGSW